MFHKGLLLFLKDKLKNPQQTAETPVGVAIVGPIPVHVDVIAIAIAVEGVAGGFF